MKILIDSNLVFDVYGRRQPHYPASNHILKLARRGTVAGNISSHTLANLFYLFGKACVPFIRESLLPHFEVTAGDSHKTQLALRAGMDDFEDALQVAAALQCSAAFIVTRNVRDFKRSPVPALSPDEWIKRFGPGLKS